MSEDSAPGRALRARREALRWSTSEVAARLCLREKVVQAIEAGDCARVVPVAYAVGYIRSYARLLELDGEALVSAFHGQNPGLKPRPEPTRRHWTRQISSTDKPIMFVSWLIGLTTLGLVAFWYHTNYMSASGELGIPAAPGEPPLAQADAELPGAPGGDPDAGLLAVGEELSGVGAGASLLAVGEEVSGVGAGTGWPVVDEVGADGAPGSGRRAPDEEISDAQPGGAEGAVVGLPAVAAAASVAEGFASLRLEVAGGESWIDIRDARGEQLFLALVNVSMERELSGLPPFAVVIGYTPPVSLYYRGEIVDLAAYVGDASTAKFTLE